MTQASSATSTLVPQGPSSMSPSLPRDPKIKPRHLARRALIYVRQSSPTQVQRHPESARRQYGLTERARALGWSTEQITVIDEDQGKSAAGSAAAHERDGFGRLVSAVGMGEVGIVLVLEVARLARNSVEWYRLLELAALAGALIADEDGIYDPREFNDRLLLGLRGTISEVELHCIQARLQGARISKAQRGELPLVLPVGYVRTAGGQVELDPDQEVQGAIQAIFLQFERLGSAYSVLRFFREHGLKVPRRPRGGPSHGELVWARPSYQAIHEVVINPVYAGAYAYGRRKQDEERLPGLGERGPRRRSPLEELEVLLRDHHPGYISWECYLANREKLRDNSQRFQSSRGAPREGQALLQGIVFCGRCGCRMKLHYTPTSPAYVCMTRRQRYGEPICQSLTIEHVDRAVSEAFLSVIRPAEVEATLALAAELERDQALVERQWQLRLERARYEAERARRQYDQVEPENRLVARELETRWNERLRALAELEGEHRREQERGLSPLTEEEKGLLRGLVGDTPKLWHATETTPEERKRLLRCLVWDVVLLRDEGIRGTGGVTTIRIDWRSGASTELRARRPASSDSLKTPEPVLERIRALAQHHPDDQIAEILNAEGLRTRWELSWNGARVQGIRAYQQIPTACPNMPRGCQVRGDGLIPVGVAAAKLGMTRSALLHWLKLSVIQGEQRVKDAPLWVRLTAEDLARLDGTLAAQGYGRWRIREAQGELDLSKEEIWQQVREGRLIAYRARVADHWEWHFDRAEVGHPTSAISLSPAA